jgi:exopolysaccharide biosynthesis WecB/TagA/CpsF family protein
MEIVKTICNSGAGITFVGIGCPRQEVWAYEFKNLLRMPVVAVGAAFNFHSGRLAQAPSWLQRAGLEWLFRMTREPSRLWKRYLILNPYYLFLLSCQWSGLRQFDPDSTTQPNNEMLYG